jgi:hypothetical protein
MAPPTQVHIIGCSPNTNRPSNVAQTNCRNWAGCVTVISALSKAFTRVTCPAVASAATQKSKLHSVKVGGLQDNNAGGKRTTVTIIDK